MKWWGVSRRHEQGKGNYKQHIARYCIMRFSQVLEDGSTMRVEAIKKISSTLCCQSLERMALPALGPISYKNLPYGPVFVQDESSGWALGPVHRIISCRIIYFILRLQENSTKTATTAINFSIPGASPPITCSQILQGQGPFSSPVSTTTTSAVVSC